MIYRSVDTIPGKIFFKIIETGDLLLLTDEKEPLEDTEKEKFYTELQEIWLKIQEEDDKIASNKESVKVIDISSRLEELTARQAAVGFAVHVLKLNPENKDKELIQLIKDRKYKFHFENSKNAKRVEKQYLKDLDRIEKENKSESIRIKSLQDQLPEIEENNENINFDEAVISYGVIVGSGFIDTNKITQSQYRALIKIGNQKMKALENE
jgi:hypothetical protein